MKINTIQITSEEDRQITYLKKALGLSSKKAVVVKGIRALQETLSNQERRRRLQSASKLVRKESQKANQEWAPLSTAHLPHED